MFKLVAVLAFVAACSATYDFGPSKTYMVDVGKDYIKIANEFGRYITFKVDKYYGFEAPQNIFVEYYGKHETPRLIKFFDQKTRAEGLYQSEILYKIFNEYNGEIDAVQYEKILDLIREYVKNDQLYPAILYALKALYGDEEALNYFYQQAYQTPYNRLGWWYGKGYRYGDYDQETPFDKFSLYFGKNYGYGDYNRDYYNKDYYRQGYSSYFPRQYAFGKGIYENYYGPYNYERQYTRDQGLYQQTPYKKWGFLFGKAGFGYDNTQSRDYGMTAQYPSRYGYAQEFYGPYNREYQQFNKYGYEYPQSFYGQYPKYGYQYGKTYGLENPTYAEQYYGPYANRYQTLFRGYGDNLYYQRSNYY